MVAAASFNFTSIGAFQQRAYGRGVGLVLDPFIFQVPRHQPDFNLRRVHVNVGYLGSLAASI